MGLSARLLTLRKSPILLKLPPYLSALCVLIGIAWLFILPLDEYSRQNYVSENAIMPGQVHTYFGGSEHNVFRAYRQEVYQISSWDERDRNDGLARIVKDIGLKVARQPYTYTVAGEEISGTNVYGLLQGPRADATEAMVLMAAWTNFEGQINYSGIALVLTLARYFKRWSIWSKDIVVLISADSTYGPEAWAAAYHSTALDVTAHRNITALPIKAGALQAVVALDYPVGPWGHRFDKLDILYDGINGALPNLDLLNTAVSIASGMGIGCSIHNMVSHSDSYQDRLTTVLKGMATQAAGHATGPHSAFMPYHVDAITLKTVGDGWHDEMSLGRVTESVFRSINNLLEHLHQSFFFYILLNSNRFTSIGNYLPAAMLVACSFSVTALGLWVQSGRAPIKSVAATATKEKGQLADMEVVKEGNDIALVPKPTTEPVEREMFLPALVLLAIHLASIIPLYLLSHTHKSNLSLVHHIQTILSIALPALITTKLRPHISAPQLQTLHSLSLLLLGATLSTLATLNFSLAFLTALCASPIAFIRPLPKPTQRYALAISTVGILGYMLACPAVLMYGLGIWAGEGKGGMEAVLGEMARGWVAQGVYTAGVIWGVWWPAWVVGGVVGFSGLV